MSEQHVPTMSDPLRDPKVRSRVMTLCRRLDIDSAEGVRAFSGDDEFLQFAHRTGESLDWLLCGDAASRKHLPRKPGPKKGPETPEERRAVKFERQQVFTEGDWLDAASFARIAVQSLSKDRAALRIETKQMIDHGGVEYHRGGLAQAAHLMDRIAKAIRMMLDRNAMVLEELGYDLQSPPKRPPPPVARPKPLLRLVK